MRFQLLARTGHPDFLDLPWAEPLAEREHGLSRRLSREGLLAVEAVVSDRTTADGPTGEGTALDAVLITRQLSFSLPYRYRTGGTCPSARVATSPTPRRWRHTSPPSCPTCPSSSA
ncbi:hypothetical protein BH24ACT3_BH24ACT3_19480 [soil metagenome]